MRCPQGGGNGTGCRRSQGCAACHLAEKRQGGRCPYGTAPWTLCRYRQVNNLTVAPSAAVFLSHAPDSSVVNLVPEIRELVAGAGTAESQGRADFQSGDGTPGLRDTYLTTLSGKSCDWRRIPPERKAVFWAMRGPDSRAPRIEAVDIGVKLGPAWLPSAHAPSP